MTEVGREMSRKNDRRWKIFIFRSQSGLGGVVLRGRMMIIHLPNPIYRPPNGRLLTWNKICPVEPFQCQ